MYAYVIEHRRGVYNRTERPQNMEDPGTRLNIKIVFLGIGIPVIKIRRSWTTYMLQFLILRSTKLYWIDFNLLFLMVSTATIILLDQSNSRAASKCLSYSYSSIFS